ncbi:MAG: hypothetical protein N2C14_26995 [Planctomycetales bacterium]
MSEQYTDADLEHFLEEALPAEETARMENDLRNDPELANRLAAASARRDAGAHSIGGVWRRRRLTCPDRQELGAFLLGVMEPGLAEYLEFHLDVIGCRACQANLDDLRDKQAETADVAQTRRRKYFHSSSGFLPGK